MKSIQVTIAEDGSIKVEAQGFKGNSCERATAELIKALGVNTGGAKKPEFFQQNQEQVKAGQG